MNKITICGSDSLVKSGTTFTYTDTYGEAYTFPRADAFLDWWVDTGGPDLSLNQHIQVFLERDIYRLISTKGTRTITATTLDDAIAQAEQMNDELRPAYGVTVEDSDGNTVWEVE